METQPNTPKLLYRVIKVMYNAILIGTLIYMILVFIAMQYSGQRIVTDKFIVQYMWSAVLLLTIAVIPGTYYLFKKKMESIKESDALVQKLMFYRTPFILRLALLEACCIVDTTFYFITGNNYILYAAIIVLIVLLINFPTKNNVSNDLKLSSDEGDQL